MVQKLIRHHIIRKTLTCKTGLHIGGSKDDLEIGGVENPIIRDPLTRLPYIPGSSIKGKMRSLIETTHDRVGWKWVGPDEKKELKHFAASGDPCGCGLALDFCPVCTVFGTHNNQKHNLGPTRLIVRDAFLTGPSRVELESKIEPGNLFAEVKYEVIINRNSGKAAGAGPRPIERVPAGTKFDVQLVLRVFDGDKLEMILPIIDEAWRLLENDYLGGSGSRGCGQVEMSDPEPDTNEQDVGTQAS